MFWTTSSEPHIKVCHTDSERNEKLMNKKFKGKAQDCRFSDAFVVFGVTLLQAAGSALESRRIFAICV